MKEVFTDDSTYSIPYKLWSIIISSLKDARSHFIHKRIVRSNIELKRAVMILKEYNDYRLGIIRTIPFDKKEITEAINRILIEVE